MKMKSGREIALDCEHELLKQTERPNMRISQWSPDRNPPMRLPIPQVVVLCAQR